MAAPQIQSMSASTEIQQTVGSQQGVSIVLPGTTCVECCCGCTTCRPCQVQGCCTEDLGYLTTNGSDPAHRLFYSCCDDFYIATESRPRVKYQRYGCLDCSGKFKVKEGKDLIGYAKEDKPEECEALGQSLIMLPVNVLIQLAGILLCGVIDFNLNLCLACQSESFQICDFTPDWIYLSKAREEEVRMTPRKVCCGCIGASCCEVTWYDLIVKEEKVGTVHFNDQRCCGFGDISIDLDFSGSSVTENDKLKALYLAVGWTGEKASVPKTYGS